MPLSGLRKVLNINPWRGQHHSQRFPPSRNTRPRSNERPEESSVQGKGRPERWLYSPEPRADEQQKASAARAFFSRFARGASAKTVWGSMQAEQVSIAQ